MENVWNMRHSLAKRREHQCEWNEKQCEGLSSCVQIEEEAGRGHGSCVGIAQPTCAELDAAALEVTARNLLARTTIS